MSGDARVGRIVDEHHEMRIPHARSVTPVGHAVVGGFEVERAGRVERNRRRVEGNRTHVDRRRDDVTVRVGLDVDDAASAVGIDDEPLAVAEAGANRGPRETPHAVPAHLGAPTVGVVEHHRAIGAALAGQEEQQAVGADAQVAVAQRARRRHWTDLRRGPGSRSQWRAASRSGSCSSAPQCQQGRQRVAGILADLHPRDTRVPAGTTAPGGGRSAPCGGPPRRARHRATARSPPGRQAPPCSRSPAGLCERARHLLQARAPRRRAPRRASPRTAARCGAPARHSASTSRRSTPGTRSRRTTGYPARTTRRACPSA